MKGLHSFFKTQSAHAGTSAGAGSVVAAGAAGAAPRVTTAGASSLAATKSVILPDGLET